MKIAGKKNSGAWYRMNKKIRKLETEEERANLAGSIAASDYIDTAFNDMLALQGRAGLVLTGIPANKTAWAQRMVDGGIPHQIWMGRLSWTTTTKDEGIISDDEYTQDFQSSFHHFGKDIRRICYQYFLVRRQMRDLCNIGTAAEGNPGGFPDGIEE